MKKLLFILIIMPALLTACVSFNTATLGSDIIKGQISGYIPTHEQYGPDGRKATEYRVSIPLYKW